MAAEAGNVDVAKLLVADERTDVNQADEEGSTPLHTAAQADNVDVVEILVRSGRLNESSMDAAKKMEAERKGQTTEAKIAAVGEPEPAVDQSIEVDQSVEAEC
eukprot:SAG22_NODE_791_length_7210_cov_40.904936_7_plen_103_part_00